MKKVIAAVALVTASGATMAAGISHGNVDLDGWVVEHPPRATTVAISESTGIISRHNVDLFGWVVENPPAAGVKSSVAARESETSIGHGNVDLHGWVVSDVAGE